MPAYAASVPLVGTLGVVVGASCSSLPSGTSGYAGCAEIFAGIAGLVRSKAFAIPLQVTNNTNKPLVLKSNITITNSTNLPFAVQGMNPPACTVLPVGSVVKVIVYANSDGSPNQSTTFDLTVPWGHDCNDTDHLPIEITGVFIPSFFHAVLDRGSVP